MADTDLTNLQKDQQHDLTHLLITGVVHDFNNLLTTILANTSLARQSAHPQTALYNQLFRAEKAALEAQSLAAQLLQQSKGGSQEWEVLDFGALIREAAELALSGSEVSIEFDGLEGLWPVRVQKGPISQVMLNLFVNAVQAMPQGGQIKVSSENIPDNSGQVKVTITDTGEGISEDCLARIFEPHFTTKETGSGVGLAASKAIVENHGGQIGVKSTVGMGTSFVILLPAQRNEVIPNKLDNVNDLLLYKGQGRLLLVEDDLLVLNTLCDMLTYLGYEVDVASRGDVALNYFKAKKQASEPFNAVIVDLTLPKGMSAVETIAQMKNEDESLKVIVTSGYSEKSFQKKGHPISWDAYMAKPYTVQILSKIVKEVLS